MSGRTEIESASRVRLADAVTRLDTEDSSVAQAEDAKFDSAGDTSSTNRRCGRGATRESKDVEPGDEKPGQPGDESIGDAEGPRFLR